MPVHVKGAVGVLRAARAVHSRAAGALLAAVPALEAPFIRVGRGLLSQSKIGSGLYWYAQEDLVRRLRRSGNRFRLVALAGHDVFVDITDGTARLHYFYGEVYEPELVTALAAILRPGDVCLDIGANIGFFSVLSARLVAPSGRVVAFEPHPEACAVLRAALERNGVSLGVDVIAAAAGERDGETRLFLTSNSMLSTTDPARAPLGTDFPFDRAIAVPQMAVDSWTASHPALAARLRAIKIDVEGTEAEVLAGMSQTLQARPAATIFCETSSGSAADRWLTARGYIATCLDVREGTFGNYRYARAAATDGP